MPGCVACKAIALACKRDKQVYRLLASMSDKWSQWCARAPAQAVQLSFENQSKGTLLLMNTTAWMETCSIQAPLADGACRQSVQNCYDTHCI